MCTPSFIRSPSHVAAQRSLQGKDWAFTRRGRTRTLIPSGGARPQGPRRRRTKDRMPRSSSSTIEDLRRVIDCLPVRTREAMLEGIRANDIIVGAYSDRQGGVCPMLAAHRCGGRTSFVSFARSWDKFTGAKRARRATARELRIL